MTPVPTLAPCLVTLRNQFNSLNPSRGRGSDGWIGDPAHQARVSDHNPDARGIVHAIDVDASGPWPRSLSMNILVMHVVDSHRIGADDRLTYVIYNRRIAEASNGWRWREYIGSNPHDKHAHFSCWHKTAKELDTRNFALEGAELATQFNAEDKQELRKAAESITALVKHPSGGGEHSDVADAILNASYPKTGTTGRTLVWLNLQDLHDGAAAARVARDNAAAAALNAGHVAASVAFLNDDFPHVADPEADPIVKRLRWVLANPVT